MDHWSVTARRWAVLGPPLRPSPEDTAFAAQAIARWGNLPARALVLGVTPELATLPWPAHSLVFAADRVRAMIDHVLPNGTQAVLAEWTALPFPARSIDLCVGDGCLATFPYPSGYRAVASELARVIDGFLVLRVFVAPEQREALADITGAPTFDALKWRLGAALADRDRNVPLAAIYDAFEAAFPDRDALVARTGWSRDAIDHIEVYRDSTARYSFPTLAELRDTLADHFTELACHTPSYPLGDRFPTLVLRVREQGPNRRPSRSPTIL